MLIHNLLKLGGKGMKLLRRSTKYILFSLVVFLPLAAFSGTKAPPSQKDKRSPAYEELKKGDQYFARGEISMAIVYYQKAIEKDPSLAMAHLQLARAYGRQRKMKLYEEELKKAVQIDPKFSEARYILASWYFTTGRGKEALDEVKELIRSDPKNEKYRLFRVMVCEATKEYQKAIEDLKYLLEIHPDKVQYLLSLGGIYRKAGLKEEARECFQKVMKLAPKSFEAKMAQEMLQKMEEGKK